MTNTITISGRLTEAPSLRFISSGAAVVDVNIAHNHRKKVGDSWEDDGATFIRATVWRDHAENIASSLNKGDEVVIVGSIKQRSWESNGEKRSVIEIQADSITPSLRYATAKVTRAARNNGGGFSQPASAPVSGDPWAADLAGDSAPF